MKGVVLNDTAITLSKKHPHIIFFMTTAISKPLNEKNAIESVAFAVVCQETFNATSIVAVQKAFDSFAAELPGIEPIHAKVFNINQTQGLKIDPAQYAIGFSRFHAHTNGMHSWRFNIQANMLIVTCFDYTNWDWVSPQAFKYLTTAISELESTNKVIEVGFQMVDKFIYEPKIPPSSYSVYEVFRKDCQYLTAKAASSGLLWHVYQGWFQEAKGLSSDLAKILHQLNLSNAEETLVDLNRLSTIIDHRASIRFMPDATPIKNLLEVDGSGMAMHHRLFNELRIQHKRIISGLLTEEKLKSIGFLDAS